MNTEGNSFDQWYREDKKRRDREDLVSLILIFVPLMILILLVGWLVNSALDRGPSSDSTPIADQSVDSDAFDGSYVDPTDLPTVYTGQVSDIDHDGTPDVVLFGAVEDPVVRSLVPESTGTPPWVIALISAGGLIVAAWIGRRSKTLKQSEDN